MVYGIRSTEMVGIKPQKTPVGVSEQSLLRSLVADVHRRLNPTLREIAEQRYVGLFQCIDLAKDFFFSYTYDLTHTLQHNMTYNSPIAMLTENPPVKPMYCWNSHLWSDSKHIDSLGIQNLRMSEWILTLTHGAFVQRKCSLFGKIVNICLMARRSRFFAGTRYLKRGISDAGAVANDVEIEQILHEESGYEGIFSSFVQVRGSIPIFWTQETSVTMPKPPIVLSRIDPTYVATKLHFADLFRRYGAPIMVLDLTKQSERREREVIVSHEFRRAVQYMNVDLRSGDAFLSTSQVRYCALDFSHMSKHHQMNVLDALEDIAKWTLDETSFFRSSSHECSAPQKSQMGLNISKHGKPQLAFTFSRQSGVVRTNCIDCLDRTNVAQFALGAAAMNRMLLSASENRIILVLMDLYSTVGDSISMQYGGSEAHRKMAQQRTGRDITGTTAMKHKELLTSIRRYYSNAFTDRLKQDAINIFLGNFRPCDVSAMNDESHDLWELESDYYLHNFRVQRGAVQSMLALRDPWLSNSSSDENEQLTVSIRLTKSKPCTRHIRLQKERCENTLIDHRRFRVIRRCQRQADFLSKWWRDALFMFDRQSDNITIPFRNVSIGAHQEHVDRATVRFNRLHQPHKLSQFDKVFTHDFLIPIALAKYEGEEALRISHTRKLLDSAQDERGCELQGGIATPTNRIMEEVPAEVVVNRDSVGDEEYNGHSFPQKQPCDPLDICFDVSKSHGPAPYGHEKITIGKRIQDIFSKSVSTGAADMGKDPKIPGVQSDQAAQPSPSAGPSRRHCVETPIPQRACSIEHTAGSQLFAAARLTRHKRMTRQDVRPSAWREIANKVDVFSQERGDLQHEFEFYAHAAQDSSVLSEPQSSRSCEICRRLSFHSAPKSTSTSSLLAYRAFEHTVCFPLPKETYVTLPFAFVARDIEAAIHTHVDAIMGLDRTREVQPLNTPRDWYVDARPADMSKVWQTITLASFKDRMSPTIDGFREELLFHLVIALQAQDTFTKYLSVEKLAPLPGNKAEVYNNNRHVVEETSFLLRETCRAHSKASMEVQTVRSGSRILAAHGTADSGSIVSNVQIPGVLCYVASDLYASHDNEFMKLNEAAARALLRSFCERRQTTLRSGGGMLESRGPVEPLEYPSQGTSPWLTF
mmetsp:Transcript_29282/g.89612  ORF Transcript_29282/g.89612 Transcript_29282/m.89612 type:complete len:1152 (+) Transcript_29282:172-3627(+)